MPVIGCRRPGVRLPMGRERGGWLMRPRRILVVYLLLFAVAVPWYWQFLPIADDRFLLGMPVWACGAVAGSLLISLFSCWTLLRRWPCEDSAKSQSEAPGAVKDSAP